MPYTPQIVTVTEHYEDAGGFPLAGRVIFRPSVTIKTPNGTVPTAPVVYEIDSAGDLVAPLLGSNGADISPKNWTYEVTEITGPPGSSGALGIDAFTRRVFHISLPIAPSSVVLRDLTKVESVRASQFEVRSVAGVGADFDGNVPLTAEDLAAVGEGFASQAALDLLTARAVVLENHPPNHAARHAPAGVDDLSGYYVAVNRIGAINGVAGLDASGLIDTSVLPALSITDVSTVSTEAGMLGLVAQKGDVAVRSDIDATFILAASPASTLANWVRLPIPGDAVLSVAGKAGVVTLVKGDVGLGNVDNVADSAKPVSTLQAAAIALQVPLTQKAAALGVATLDAGAKVPIAQIPALTIATTTALQLTLDDNVLPSSDLAMYGDFLESVPRYMATSQDVLSSGYLTFAGSFAMRSTFTATKLRFHVRVVNPAGGVITFALYKGATRVSLAKQGADIAVTTSFSAIGIKQLTIPSLVVNRGDFVYLGMLRTGTGTPDPGLSTTAGPAVIDLFNPSAAEMLVGYKSGQAALPATLDVSASYTAAGKQFWFSLAP